MKFLAKYQFIFLLLGPATVVHAQNVSVGVVGGAGLTQDFQNQILYFAGGARFTSYSTPRRWVAGASLEIGLPQRLSVEAEALYHELEFTDAGIEPDGMLNSVSPSPVVTWEFPVLAKYRFRTPLVQPFFEVGPSFRSSGNLNGTSPSGHGFGVGVGAEKVYRKARIDVLVRYLRWASDHRPLYQISPITIPDQVEVLIGVSFRLRKSGTD